MVKGQLQKMNACKCNQCKMYKKHMKALELLKRYELREVQITKQIDIMCRFGEYTDEDQA